MKRFTETLKWDDPWFMELPMESKLFWQWLLDHCDHAGVIDPNVKLAAFQIGCRKGSANLLDSLGDRVAKLPNGKVWIVKFMEFQYPRLSEKCPAHTPVFKSIEKNELNSLALDYPKGIPTLKDKDKDKEEGKDTEKERFSTKARAANADECAEYATEINLPASDGRAFFDGKEQNGWKAGKVAVKDWKAAMRTWKANGYHPSQKGGEKANPNRVHKGHGENVSNKLSMFK